jgi:4-hydroxy-tetrahydrodipicolinate reductase
MIRICVAGATGWVGRPLCLAIQKSDGLTLAAAFARRESADAVGDIRVSTTIEDALRPPSEVFVDFTHPDAVKRHTLLALAAKRHVVLGTSGLADADFAEIDASARAAQRGVVAVGNFALSAVLLQRFAAEAAKHLRSWEIVDYATDAKVDAPSGTARELAWRLSQVAVPEVTVPVDRTIGARDSRGATLSRSQVHSIRLPGYTIGVEVRFGATGERLTMTYDGGVEPDPYIAGTLLAIRRVAKVQGLVRGLDALL